MTATKYQLPNPFFSNINVVSSRPGSWKLPTSYIWQRAVTRRHNRQDVVFQPVCQQHLQGLVLPYPRTTPYTTPYNDWWRQSHCYCCTVVRHGWTTETRCCAVRHRQNLQKLHAFARTVVRSSCPWTSTPILADSHWLPVAARIKYKVALMTFKAMTTRRPAYLADL